MPAVRTIPRMPASRTRNTGKSATVANAALLLQQWQEEQTDFVPGSAVETDLVPRLSPPEFPALRVPAQNTMEAVVRRLEEEPERKERNARVAELEAAHGTSRSTSARSGPDCSLQTLTPETKSPPPSTKTLVRFVVTSSRF